MVEKIDMEKLQKLVYYINNVKMTGVQRDALNCVIVGGILRGEIDTDDLFVGASSPDISNLEDFLASELNLGHVGLIQSQVLYDQYCIWCKETKQEPQGQTAFGRNLVGIGVQRKKKSDENYYYIEDEHLDE